MAYSKRSSWTRLTWLLPLALMVGWLHAETPPLAGFSTTQALGDDVPLPEEEAFRVEAVALDDSELLVRFTMPEGYYLYRDKSRLLLDGEPGVDVTPTWPRAEAHHDEHFGAVAVYYGQIEVPVKLSGRADAGAPLTLLVRMQGCKENSVCYPPMQRRIEL